VSQQKRATLFVSPEGNDAWSGTLERPNATHTDGPFATPARAQEAVRALKAKGLAAPVTVLLRGGTYFLPETLVFTPADSGTKECPITYAAYPGETPILSGGKVVGGGWEPYAEQIRVCPLPQARDKRWVFRQLTADGEKLTRARLPKHGYYRIEEAVKANAFRYRPGDMQRWHNLEDVEVVVLHSWDESRLIIATLDEAQRLVTFTGAPEKSHPFGWPGAHGPNRYYVENLRAAITQPGDWYLDARAGALYYWPQGDLSRQQLVAPVLKQLVRFEGNIAAEKWVEHLHFRGLTFCDADWPLPPTGYPGCGDVGDIVEPSALNLEGARYCSLEGCCLKNVGTYALELAGYGNRIVENEIHHTGSGGIVTRNFHPEHNLVAYNHIHHCGDVFPSAVGINIDDGGGTFAHNLVHDIAHSGIYARHWPTDHQPQERRNQEQGLVIEYNEIYNVSLLSNDSGGIFVRDSNMIIRNNLIHDVYSPGEGTPGWGIYLGCESRNSEVRNNVVYRTRDSLHMLWGNRYNVIENNILVDAQRYVLSSHNSEQFVHTDVVLRHNILAFKGDETKMARILGERSLVTESDYNIWFPAKGQKMVIEHLPGVEDYDAWRGRGYEAHSVVADPLFVDWDHDNYALRPDSPALKLGFQPIDLSTVGLRGKK
jgi:hypothetical protein